MRIALVRAVFRRGRSGRRTLSLDTCGVVSGRSRPRRAAESEVNTDAVQIKEARGLPPNQSPRNLPTMEEEVREAKEMSDLDSEQNRRIRDVESRVNELENQIAVLVGKLDATTGMLKAVAIGVGALVGLDLQGLVM